MYSRVCTQNNLHISRHKCNAFCVGMSRHLFLFSKKLVIIRPRFILLLIIKENFNVSNFL